MFKTQVKASWYLRKWKEDRFLGWTRPTWNNDTTTGPAHAPLVLPGPFARQMPQFFLPAVKVAIFCPAIATAVAKAVTKVQDN
ncbi:hypothetical protein GE21DRAFT_3806 [Neurospora crassa]|uniref:Uncharacterized protein n=1 Tax=Neurospora crassa (strain ATCC 24698 / 74-OR23-1A / CBS 708.71 / DSM 1257 / FGSC 987) TaxID=367110 RepID=Q7S0Z5_NEUCR|nr:hypothetical protein NCU09149 [Neurospora crassa OR74A]EAA29005.1 hypothetical protein NCU09149 [Neurospora crassa OR74A]KHE84374.1 hypothetical protein GE21DRAFT_3806 [Neurospora crassa]|eukprot:XP_958241.1 hypothetical protein NCU09149 [Neurospora crassa OR74A]